MPYKSRRGVNLGRISKYGAVSPTIHGRIDRCEGGVHGAESGLDGRSLVDLSQVRQGGESVSYSTTFSPLKGSTGDAGAAAARLALWTGVLLRLDPRMQALERAPDSS